MRRYALVEARDIFADDPYIHVVSSSRDWVHLHITPALGLMEKIGGYLRGELSSLPGPTCEELSLAVEELVSNSIEHGCQLNENCQVEMKFVRTVRSLIFQVSDPGPGFAVESVVHAAVNNPPEEPLRHTQFRSDMGLRPGGFGIMLAKKIADELIYNQSGNEVMLIKYLDGV